MAKPPYNSAAWRAVRKRVLQRDGYECQLKFWGCLGVASAVDHRLPVGSLDPRDPALLDEANLQAACVPCNTRKRNALARRRNTTRVPITPPPRGDGYPLVPAGGQVDARSTPAGLRVSRNW
jgi:5-methylcytosine-specific restriction endonuclease McrA